MDYVKMMPAQRLQTRITGSTGPAKHVSRICLQNTWQSLSLSLAPGLLQTARVHPRSMAEPYSNRVRYGMDLS